MSIAALIVAAGRGERAGAGVPKQYRDLCGRPVLFWSVDAFRAAGVGEIIVVAAPEQLNAAQNVLSPLGVPVTVGGDTRSMSVRNGLAAIPREAEIVMIHDAARPGLTATTVRALAAAIEAGSDGAAPALPVFDALWRGQGQAEAPLDRDGVFRVQTPQAFRASIIHSAYERAGDKSFPDDIAVARAAGTNVTLIAGDERLMKLTTQTDFATLERLMAGQRIACVGQGFDVHRFGEGDHVTLCGVQIPHDRGLQGHSDADVAWHALVDAILGALGEGDIGAHFPPSDIQWKGANSELFLAHARDLAAARKARINHVDVTIVCERPKIGPHRDAMRVRTASVLGLPVERVSVKATTSEGLGFTGRSEGVAAQATATLERFA